MLSNSRCTGNSDVSRNMFCVRICSDWGRFPIIVELHEVISITNINNTGWLGIFYFLNIEDYVHAIFYAVTWAMKANFLCYLSVFQFDLPNKDDIEKRPPKNNISDKKKTCSPITEINI